MADNPKKRGKPDRSRVSIGQRHEVRYWTRRFQCTPRELVLAVWNALDTGGAATPEAVGNVLVSAQEQLRFARKNAR